MNRRHGVYRRSVSWASAMTLLVGALSVGGCMIPRQRVVANETPPPIARKVTPHFPTSLYTLAPGDVLEFLYLTTPKVTNKPYTLQVKDQVDIEFHLHPQLNRTLRVRPDGAISIPRKRDVKVAGLTADEVSSMLRKNYSDLLKDPEITVTVREFNAKLDELQKAIATAPFGQARVVTVQPDGRLALPLLTDVPAEGATLPQLTSLVNAQYAGVMPDMTVSVLLKEVGGNLIFVDGDVNKPGVFPVKGPTSVQAAVAMAGGLKETAEPSTVLVVSKMPDGRFLSRTTDLTRMTSGGDFMLGRDDLVYVPQSAIARANTWVDQNIRRILLFTGWSLGLQSDLGRTTVR